MEKQKGIKMSGSNEPSSYDEWRIETGIWPEEIKKAVDSIIPGVSKAKIFNYRMEQRFAPEDPDYLDKEDRTIIGVVGHIILFEGINHLTCTDVEYASWLRNPHFPIKKGFNYRIAEPRFPK